MNWKTISAALVVFIALVVLVAGGMWLAGNRKPTQLIVLPDGTRLTVRTVTYQSPHEVAYGSGWRDKLYQLLPFRMAKRFGAKVNSQTSTRTNNMVVWLQSGGVPTAPGATAPAPFMSPNFRAVVVDENGIESTEQYVSYQRNPGVFGVELQNAPRRSREFTLRIYDSAPMGKRTSIGDFKIANRFPVTTPGWTAETLPATRETNGLSVTLLGVETGRKSWSDYSRSDDEPPRYSRVQFDLKENGRLATNWGISKMHFDSVASGPVEPGSYSHNWGQGHFSFGFQGSLWPEEPAWKVMAEAWRLGDFPAEELWVITNIAVPNPREVTEVNAKTNILGAPAELLGIIMSGAASPKGWDAGMSMGGSSTLHVLLDAHPADVHLALVEVHDDRGRTVGIEGSGYSGSGTNKMHHAFGLKFPDGAKTVDVTLAISKGRNVTFLVKPTFTNTPAATNR